MPIRVPRHDKEITALQDLNHSRVVVIGRLDEMAYFLAGNTISSSNAGPYIC